MATLIVWDIISLDGYFEGSEQWDLRLHEYIWGKDLERLSLSFGEDLGLLVFGRVTNSSRRDRPTPAEFCCATQCLTTDMWAVLSSGQGEAPPGMAVSGGASSFAGDGSGCGVSGDAWSV